MIALQSIRHLFVVALAALGLAGITASIGLLATAQPALAAEKTADLAKYCRKHVGRRTFPNIDRRDDGLMCSWRTSRGRGLRHRKIKAADVCAGQYRTRRFRRKGKGLICITGSGGGATAAKTIDLKKHCRARYGRRAFVTRRRTDGRPMCTIRTHRGRGLRHHLIDLAGLCGGGSPRAVGNKLRCEGSTAGPGAPPGGRADKPPSGGGRGAASGRRGPLPTPSRKGGGKVTKADFRGCSNDPAIRRREASTPGHVRGPYYTYSYGAVPTPCPGLAGGKVVNLVEFCRKDQNRNKGVVYLGGGMLACFGPPGRVSTRPFQTPAELKRDFFWSKLVVLYHACYWAGGFTLKKERNFRIVFKYVNGRLECFYFKTARFAAINQRGYATIRKPGKAKISSGRIEFVSANRSRKVLAKLRPGLLFIVRLIYRRNPGGERKRVTLRQLKGGATRRYTARRVGRTNVFETGVIKLVERVTP